MKLLCLLENAPHLDTERKHDLPVFTTRYGPDLHLHLSVHLDGVERILYTAKLPSVVYARQSNASALAEYSVGLGSPQLYDSVVNTPSASHADKGRWSVQGAGEFGADVFSLIIE